jgi:hypothetical protein
MFSEFKFQDKRLRGIKLRRKRFVIFFYCLKWVIMGKKSIFSGGNVNQIRGNSQRKQGFMTSSIQPAF